MPYETHPYATATLEHPCGYYDFETLNINWSSPERYEVETRIGGGRYSDAFLGWDCKEKTNVVIKVLKPIKRKKIRRELKMLQNLQGGPNIVRLIDTVRTPQSEISSFVFEHINAAHFRGILPTMSNEDILFTMYELMRALQHAHSNGIMHRDVKPQNVMVDYNKRILRVIDWGLAEFYFPDNTYSVSVASRYFKGPELLVGIHSYDYSLDMWSAGCMFASMLFIKDPFFHGADNMDQLVKIADVLGTNGLFEFLAKYNVPLSHSLSVAVGLRPRIPWQSFVQSKNTNRCTEEALDLLDKMLRYDYKDRIQPLDAMKHPYFASLNAAQGSATQTHAEAKQYLPDLSSSQSSEDPNI